MDRNRLYEGSFEMTTTITETRTHTQGSGQTRLIEHENRLFKVFYSIDHSYHNQSRAYIEIWNGKTFETITTFNLFEQFYIKNINNRQYDTIDIKEFTEFYENIIKDFINFMPSTIKEALEN